METFSTVDSAEKVSGAESSLLFRSLIYKNELGFILKLSLKIILVVLFVFSVSACKRSMHQQKLLSPTGNTAPQTPRQ